jgi:predicted GNAT superfamily acetyltransferase
MSDEIRIADIDAVDQMRQVEALEQEVWDIGDRDVLPVTMLVATRAVGAILVGAWEGETLVGFAYGFPGIEDGRTTIHSHMLAVKATHRDRDLGYRLKLAQRERALALGVSEMTWTFDPLQSRNAWFNVAKLGVVADRYLADFYGDEHSSFLLSGGTDRLWARWLLGSRRGSVAATDVGDAAALVEVGADGVPRYLGLEGARGAECVAIRIPADVNALRRDDPGLAAAWREATRAAFTEAFAAGFAVEDFARQGGYILRRISSTNAHE